MGIFGTAKEGSTYFALYKAYTVDSKWNEIGDRLQAASYLSRVDHYWKIRTRKQRADIAEYSVVNRSITEWSGTCYLQGSIGTSYSKNYIFKTRVAELETQCGKLKAIKVKRSEVMGSEL